MCVLSNLNISNLRLAKLILKVNFEGKSSAKIQLISIHTDFVRKSNTNDFMFYKNDDFVIWSTQDFLFDERQIRLPDELNICAEMAHTYIFSHDQARYETLKKMYDTLNKWSQRVDYMQGRVNLQCQNKVVMAGDYWYVT